MTEEAKRRKREYNRRYRKEHADKFREWSLAYYYRNREKCLAYWHKRRKANYEHVLKIERATRERNRSSARLASERRYWECVLKMEKDPEFYAEYRRKKREWNARRSQRKGIKYRPKPSIRIPDHFVRGQCVLDRGSPFIYENAQTPAANDAFGKELFFEHLEKEWK